MAKGEELQSGLTNLLNNLQPLEQWIGRGGASFSGVKARVNEESIKLNRALDEIGVSLAEIAKTFHVTDDEAEAEMTKAGGAFDGISTALGSKA